MDEAFKIIKFITKRTGRAIKFKDAKYLASFDFPLEVKLTVIENVLNIGGAGRVFSALYFRQEFIKEESKYHKGEMPKPHSDFSSIRDILSPPLSGTL